MLVCTAVLSAAQGLTDAAFEAATMKRNVSGVENWSLNPRPTGQFTVTNGRVSDIVQAAFLIQDYQLEGLPAWTRSERYDIVAKLDASPPDRVRCGMRSAAGRILYGGSSLDELRGPVPD